MPSPLLSICVTAYNIEPYIGECLESILRQKVNFEYEIIIGEDCSTDRTLHICEEYQSKYSNIHVYRNQRNLGNMGNMIHTLEKCNAKYVALMDGDDLWIDENKLQKQIDFLESNPDYSYIFHDAHIADKSLNFKSTFSLKFPERDYAKPYTLHQLVKWRVIGPTSSHVFRNNLKPYPDWSKDVYGPELFLTFLAFEKGNIKYLPDIMSVYRVRDNGTDNSFSKIGLAERNIREYKTYRKALSPGLGFFFLRKILRNHLYLVLLHLSKRNYAKAMDQCKICLSDLVSTN